MNETRTGTGGPVPRLAGATAQEQEPTGAVWIKLETAAKLIDSTAPALRKRLSRMRLPPGLVTRFGGSIRINRTLFLAWVGSGTAEEK